ncbi:MAG: AbrB/MazE/SpoVT family DNA-binding domain-containing protein [Pseudonocardiaceae bacterium]
MKAKVSEKGQVTIPKQLRGRLGIKAGEELDFTEEHGGLVVRKVHHRSPVDSIYGILKQGGSTDEFIEELRGPAELP